MIKGYITILDTKEDKTHIYPIWLKDQDEVDQFLIEKGYDPRRIQYMITDNIKFEIH